MRKASRAQNRLLLASALLSAAYFLAAFARRTTSQPVIPTGAISYASGLRDGLLTVAMTLCLAALALALTIIGIEMWREPRSGTAEKRSRSENASAFNFNDFP